MHLNEEYIHFPTLQHFAPLLIKFLEIFSLRTNIKPTE